VYTQAIQRALSVVVQKSNFSFAHPELLVPIKYTMPLQGGEEINGFYV